MYSEASAEQMSRYTKLQREGREGERKRTERGKGIAFPGLGGLHNERVNTLIMCLAKRATRTCSRSVWSAFAAVSYVSDDTQQRIGCGVEDHGRQPRRGRLHRVAV